MRAAAVLLVVFMHSGYTFFPGDSGVTVFFAISGFIITFILLRERAGAHRFDLGRFYWRRFVKLAPPFVVVVAIPTLVYAMCHPISWFAFGSQVFFTFNWVMIHVPLADRVVLPGSEVVWTLAVEEQFYIVFAIVWLVLFRRTWWARGLAILSVTTVVVSLVVRVSVAGSDTTHALRGTDARMEAIAWGVLAALALSAHRSGRAPAVRIFATPWALVVAFVLYAASFLVPDGWPELAFRPTLWAVAGATVILYGMLPGHDTTRTLFYRFVSWPPFQTIGLASYSIYLVHFEMNFLIGPLLADLPILVQRIVFIVAGLAAGIGVYYAVEKPASRLNGLLGRPSPPSAPGTYP